MEGAEPSREGGDEFSIWVFQGKFHGKGDA